MATAELSTVISGASSAIPKVPPLCTGDRLTRVEFERRYAAMPRVKKAELIEGVVYMPSPVSMSHGEPHSSIVAWLKFYAFGTPGTQAADNVTVRLDGENEPQPDALLRILPKFGGQSRDDDGFVRGAPELLAEISVSSVSYDLHDKLRAYQRNGVREYVVWRVEDETIDWLMLREGRFERLSTTAAGHYRSEIFPGLWLDPAALLRGDGAALLAVLQEGIASPEHTAFVEKLRGVSRGKV